MKARVMAVLSVLAVLATVTASVALAGTNRNYSAHLTGAQEAPSRDTPAQGQAIFTVSLDGSSIAYKLIVANIENVVGAHVHCGAVGVNGSVGVSLFTAASGGGRFSGVLADGAITGATGCGWTSVANIIAAFNAGAAYVNVHTNDGVTPTNTGPGDYPGGEIRGQVR